MRTWTATVPVGAIAAPWPDDTDGSFITPEGWVDARTTLKPPLWLQAPLDFHRLIALPEQRTLYTQLNEVTGTKDESLTDFGVRIHKEAERSNPANIVVDLRLNFGGNWDLRSGYIRELIKAEDEDTHLFVLSGRGSFSATEAILVDLRRLSKAVFIGEPASSRPNHYGDGYRSRMPNSHIAIQTSIQWNQLSGQSRIPWTGVHIATPYSFADYAAGRDPALEAVFNYSPPPLLAPTLIDAAKGGAQGAGGLHVYRRLSISELREHCARCGRCIAWRRAARGRARCRPERDQELSGQPRRMDCACLCRRRDGSSGAGAGGGAADCRARS
jgi:hypothetical protein